MENALSHDLPNNPRASGTERHPDSNVSTASCAACKYQIGYVGACNKQDDRGEDHEHLQPLACLLLHALNATATGHNHHVLLGNN